MGEKLKSGMLFCQGANQSNDKSWGVSTDNLTEFQSGEFAGPRLVLYP
jgi:hypothetical protein